MKKIDWLCLSNRNPENFCTEVKAVRGHDEVVVTKGVVPSKRELINSEYLPLIIPAG